MAKLQTLSDEWDAKAPFGETADGEIAPAMAIDMDGEPADPMIWNFKDFCNGGYIPSNRDNCAFIKK